MVYLHTKPIIKLVVATYFGIDKAQINFEVEISKLDKPGPKRLIFLKDNNGWISMEYKLLIR